MLTVVTKCKVPLRSVPKGSYKSCYRYCGMRWKVTMKESEENNENKVDESEAKKSGNSSDNDNKNDDNNESKIQADNEGTDYNAKAQSMMNDAKSFFAQYTQKSPKDNAAALYSKVLNLRDYLVEETREAYKELTEDDTKGNTSLKKKVIVHNMEIKKPKESSDDSNIEEEVDQYQGPTELVHVKEQLGAWESMKQRIGQSKLMQELLKGGKKFQKTEIGKGATEIGYNVKDKIDDAREYWETTQNPLVYYISGTISGMTGETEEGLALGRIQKYDPDFNKELWAAEVKKTLSRDLISSHLNGDISHLEDLLSESVQSTINADIEARKKDGFYVDKNILNFEEHEMRVKLVEDHGPIMIGVYRVEQLNCVRNAKDEIIEGSETDIRAKFYSLIFRQELVEEGDDVVAVWKVYDYGIIGDVPFL